MPPRFRYSPWDGTQSWLELDAESVLSELSEDLMYHGDVHAALRRLMQGGSVGPDGRRLEGLRSLLERLAQRRREALAQHDLGGVYEDIARELREIVDEERNSVEASAPSDAGERMMRLDLLPPDLGGQIRELQDYDFASPEAAQRFEDLVDELRRQLMQGQVNRMAGAMSQLSAEDLARLKDMMAELNRMLEQRERGEEPDFASFMERYGDFFPENPRNLDELLEVMARRMAAMQAMLNSMTPEQREQLEGLSRQLLEDMDLRWEVEQLSANLRAAFPSMGWEQSYDFSGLDPLSFAEAAELLGELGDMDQLEQLMRGASHPGALAEVDLDRVRELLGEDAAHSLDELSRIARTLEEAGLIEQREGRLELTPRGVRRLGQNALGELFRHLTVDRFGEHEAARSGVGHERTFSSKPYEWGDPFNLDLGRTLRNAIARAAGEGELRQAGGSNGRRVALSPDDFEIEETEQVVAASTVLMLDLSLSMPMRDNFRSAKKVAMALHTLISMQYPRDFLGIVGFSEIAREIPAERLPEVSWDFVYGTNMHHGFMLARRMLAHRSGTKQIIMVTDGEPTAHLDESGQPQFHYPPVRETVDATLREVARCTTAGIRINTFMLDADRGLQQFVERLTELNRGRAFFTTPETLGDYVLVDFIEQKRSVLRGRSA